MNPSLHKTSKAPLPRLAITNEPIEHLKLDANNPRLHSRTQIKQIARSIESFGYNVPVLVDAELNVVAGHGRLLACRHLGWSEVPTIRLEHLDAAQRRAFMIADNRLNENSTWDDRLLAQQLKELSVLDLDFALETTGFDMGEIDLRIESLNAIEEAASGAGRASSRGATGQPGRRSLAVGEPSRAVRQRRGAVRPRCAHGARQGRDRLRRPAV